MAAKTLAVALLLSSCARSFSEDACEDAQLPYDGLTVALQLDSSSVAWKPNTLHSMTIVALKGSELQDISNLSVALLQTGSLDGGKVCPNDGGTRIVFGLSPKWRSPTSDTLVQQGTNNVKFRVAFIFNNTLVRQDIAASYSCGCPIASPCSCHACESSCPSGVGLKDFTCQSVVLPAIDCEPCAEGTFKPTAGPGACVSCKSCDPQFQVIRTCTATADTLCAPNGELSALAELKAALTALPSNEWSDNDHCTWRGITCENDANDLYVTA